MGAPPIRWRVAIPVQLSDSRLASILGLRRETSVWPRCGFTNPEAARLALVSAPRRLPRCRPGRLPARCRQRDDESGPATGTFRRHDGATMRAGDSAPDREPEAGVARGPPIGPVEPSERLEDALAVRQGNTRPGVAHR